MGTELEAFTVRLGPDDAAQVRAAAEVRGVVVAEVIRQAVTEHLARRESDRVLPLIDAAFAKHADRLAGLIAKTHIAAATAAWEARWLVYHAEPQHPELAVMVMEQSVARAGVDLRRKGATIGEAGEEEYEAAEDAADKKRGE